MKVETEEAADSAGAGEKTSERSARPGSRVAAWFRPWPSRGVPPSQIVQPPSQITRPPPQTPSPAEIDDAEVAVLIAMPSPQSSPRLSGIGDRQSPLDMMGPWTECAVGTSKLPYRRKTDDFISHVAS